jgi:uncharacterized iron-regulated membrane protein
MLTRAQWLRLHRLLGLTMAVFLLVQALTGALLVYRGPMARMLDPVGMTSHATGRPVSIGIAVTQADRALPGYHVTRIFAPDAAGATWFAHLRNAAGQARFASVDPAGGAVRRTGPLAAFPVEAALQIHYQLMAGRIGMAIVALNGLALLIMAGSGLAYWWPKRNRMKALAIHWHRAPRLVLRHAHRTLGVVAAAFMIVLAATGLLLVLPDLAGDARPLPPVAVAAAALDRGLALAQSQFPHSTLRDARIDAGRLIVNFNAPTRNARAVHRVIVSLAPSQIDQRIPADRNPALWMTILPIHAGNALGPIGQPLLLIVALALAALSLTGPLMWWHVRTQRRSPSRKPRA